MANDNHRPSKEVEQLTLVARENLRHILEGWVYYVNVGEAIDAYRRQLFRELGITKPTHQYKEIMGRYLKDNEFHRINKSTRTFLQKCIDHLPEIEKWRATLTEEERDAWNGPRAVWDHWPDKPENPQQAKPRNYSKKLTNPPPKVGEPEKTAELEKQIAGLKAVIQDKDHSLAVVNAEIKKFASAAESPEQPVWDADNLVQTDPVKAAVLWQELWPKIDTDEKRRRLNSEINRLQGEHHKIHQTIYAATRTDSTDTERLANLKGFSRLLGDRVFMVSVDSDVIDNQKVLLDRMKDTHIEYYNKVQALEAKAEKQAKRIERLTKQRDDLRADNQKLKESPQSDLENPLKHVVDARIPPSWLERVDKDKVLKNLPVRTVRSLIDFMADTYSFIAAQREAVGANGSLRYSQIANSLKLAAHDGTGSDEMDAALAAVRRLDPKFEALELLATYGDINSATGKTKAEELLQQSRDHDAREKRRMDREARTLDIVKELRFELHRAKTRNASLNNKLRKLTEDKFTWYRDGHNYPQIGQVKVSAYRLVYDAENYRDFSATCMVDIDDPSATDYRVYVWDETFGDGGDRALEWCEIAQFNDKAKALEYGAEQTQQRATEWARKRREAQEAKKAAAAAV